MSLKADCCKANQIKFQHVEKHGNQQQLQQEFMNEIIANEKDINDGIKLLLTSKNNLFKNKTYIQKF